MVGEHSSATGPGEWEADSAHSPGLSRAHAREGIDWVAHPSRHEPWPKTALLVAIIVGVAVVAAQALAHWFYGLVSLLVLTASLVRYFFPTHYALDAEGVECTLLGFVRRYAWTRFRRVDAHRDGVFLGPLPRPTRLDSFRGVFLRFHQNREEVVYFVRRHVPGQ